MARTLQKSGPSASKPLSALLLLVSRLVLVEDRRELVCRSSSKRQLHKPWRPCVHKSCSDVLGVIQDKRHRHANATSEQALKDFLAGSMKSARDLERMRGPNLSPTCLSSLPLPFLDLICKAKSLSMNARHDAHRMPRLRPMAQLFMLNGRLDPGAVVWGSAH